ncbi:MAG: extracellular solute-binding protein [Clostridia bacterium]|nr:extracellular solute-binding protein [Clostridia bacterium]
MKKLLALVLALCLVLTAAAALASADLLSREGVYPLNSDKTITWYSQDSHNIHSDFADWHDSPFHVNLSKQVGVNIEWVLPTTGADGGVFTNTLLSDAGSNIGNLPNIMEAYFMNNANQYLDDEVIWDLTPYLEEYAPAYWAWLHSNPAYDKAMKTDDGRYYAFGFFREDGGWNDSYQGPVVRKDWLEECGLEIPKTISEFENVIRVFKEKYGAVFTSAFSPRFYQMGMSGAFGAYGNVNPDYLYEIRDGKVILAQSTDEYRNWLRWFSGIVKEGLVDTDLQTVDDTNVQQKVETGLSGIAITSMGQMNLWNNHMEAAGNGRPWIGIPYPTNDAGEIYSIFGGSGIGSITGVVTKSADEETMKLCLQVLDYAYSKEGFLFWNYGIEGESWVMSEETGLPAWTDLVAKDTSNDPMIKYNGTTWSGSCIQATNLLYLKNSQASIDANDAWYYLGMGRDTDQLDKVLEVTSGHKWPTGVTFTTEESDELDLYNASLGTYVVEQCTSFLLGNKDVNDDGLWNEFISGLQQYHIDRVLELRQNCYDRYLSR